MNEKKTEDLSNILKNTHLSDFNNYISENIDSINTEEASFYHYIKGLLKKKNLSEQTVFLNADIPEKYGYKLMSGEKHTKQRDIILRICYASNFTLLETQRALKKYGMPALYSKNKRDALLMIIFNEHPGDIIHINSILKENGTDTLRTCGTQN